MLIPQLSPEEIDRHQALIREYFREVRGTDDYTSELHGNGDQKGIYKVRSGNEVFLAAAAARDNRGSLLEEYNILRSLYAGAPEYFPRPVAHYVPRDEEHLGDLFLMEFLDHADLDRFQRSQQHHQVPDFFRNLAYSLGRAVAVTNAKTGRYSSEPHDGNILLKIQNGGLEIKFCDAIQFRVGDLETAARSFLDPTLRPECYRFIKKFRDGLVEGMNAAQGLSVAEAQKRLEFLRTINDVF